MSLTQIAVYGQIQRGFISNFNYGKDDEILKLVYAYVGSLLLQGKDNNIVLWCTNGKLFNVCYDIISDFVIAYGDQIQWRSYGSNSSNSFIDFNDWDGDTCGDLLLICLDFHNLSDDEKQTAYKFKRKILLSEGE